MKKLDRRIRYCNLGYVINGLRVGWHRRFEYRWQYNTSSSKQIDAVFDEGTVIEVSRYIHPLHIVYKYNSDGTTRSIWKTHSMHGGLLYVLVKQDESVYISYTELKKTMCINIVGGVIIMQRFYIGNIGYEYTWYANGLPKTEMKYNLKRQIYRIRYNKDGMIVRHTGK